MTGNCSASLGVLANSLRVVSAKRGNPPLRKVIGINWPRTLSNESLYDRSHMKPWSILVMKRRLSWFGHLMRLPPDTPARQSLCHFVKPVKRLIGRPKTTRLSTVVNHLKEHSSIQIHQNLDTALQQLEIMCSIGSFGPKLFAAQCYLK